MKFKLLDFWQLTTIAIILVSLAGGINSASAGIAKSESYEMEYASTGAGAGISESDAGDYSFVGLIVTEGLANGKAFSTSYSIEPSLAFEVLPAAVMNWSIY